jgi:hypothetical protein
MIFAINTEEYAPSIVVYYGKNSSISSETPFFWRLRIVKTLLILSFALPGLSAVRFKVIVRTASTP